MYPQLVVFKAPRWMGKICKADNARPTLTEAILVMVVVTTLKLPLVLSLVLSHEPQSRFSYNYP
jgi:hypothetical protein